MNALTNGAAADLDAARTLLARLGIKPEQLLVFNATTCLPVA